MVLYLMFRGIHLFVCTCFCYEKVVKGVFVCVHKNGTVPYVSEGFICLFAHVFVMRKWSRGVFVCVHKRLG